MAKVALVATLTAPLSSDLHEIRQLPDAVTCLQVRADLIGDVPVSRLRSHFSGKLLYTLRGSRSGGTFAGLPLERQQRILSAAPDYDLVELEADSDLSSTLLGAIAADRRLISWSGAAGTVAHLHSTFTTIASTPARFYCLRTTGPKTSDGLQPLLLLQMLGRKDVVAFSEGPSGCWSQLLAPHFGSPLVFGQLGAQTGSTGQPAIQQLIQDYGFPALHPIQELYGIVGNRIFQSPSPRLHNTGYRALGYPAFFLPFHVECFQDFWQEMIEDSTLKSLGIPIQGLTVVSPHKEAALVAADTHSPMVHKAGSSNIFVRKNGRWEAHTTDPESIAGIGRKYGNGSPCKAAVIGCGGAGRAVAAALQQAGAEVTLVNRGKERGHRAVKLLGLPFVLLSEFQARGFTLLVNATPIGQQDDSLPFAIDSLGRGTVVVDLAYGTHPTLLVAGALARGGTVIDGHDVVLTQVRKQFQMMVGHELPATVDRETVVPRNGTRAFSPNGTPRAEVLHAREAYKCSS
jgi:3-dehydroquinate dehydratase/shikimate dehydrogenase